MAKVVVITAHQHFLPILSARSPHHPGAPLLNMCVGSPRTGGGATGTSQLARGLAATTGAASLLLLAAHRGRFALVVLVLLMRALAGGLRLLRLRLWL